MNDPNLIQLLINIDHTFKLNLTKLYEKKNISVFFLLINKIHTEKQTEATTAISRKVVEFTVLQRNVKELDERA